MAILHWILFDVAAVFILILYRLNIQKNCQKFAAIPLDKSPDAEIQTIKQIRMMSESRESL